MAEELFSEFIEHSKKEKKAIAVSDLNFKADNNDYISNLVTLLATNTISDEDILEALDDNIDILDGLFDNNSTSDIVWANIRFIDILIKLFSSDTSKYRNIKYYMISNMDKFNTKLSKMIYIKDEDIIFRACRLIEILYDQLIAEIKAIDTIEWDHVDKLQLYYMITSVRSNINSVEELNRFIILNPIGDNINNIVNLYYIFFGKEFSRVALENIYPSCYDPLIRYNSIRQTIMSGLGKLDEELNILYKRMENVLNSTRAIIVSLSTPNIVKILRIIETNKQLLTTEEPTMDLFKDKDPNIIHAINTMNDY